MPRQRRFPTSGWPHDSRPTPCFVLPTLTKMIPSSRKTMTPIMMILFCSMRRLMLDRILRALVMLSSVPWHRSIVQQSMYFMLCRVLHALAMLPSVPWHRSTVQQSTSIFFTLCAAAPLEALE